MQADHSGDQGPGEETTGEEATAELLMGVARQLRRRFMAALEEYAASNGLTLLVLDTETGSLAESLYTRWGWQTVGGIPDYAISPAGELGGTTIMYKRLPARSPGAGALA